MSNVILGTFSAHLIWVKNNTMQVAVSKPVQRLCSKTTHLENLPDGTNVYSWIAIAIWSLKTKVLSTEKKKNNTGRKTTDFLCFTKGVIQVTEAFTAKTKLADHVPHRFRARDRCFQRRINPVV